MTLTPVQSLRLTAVRIVQETIDINEKKEAKPTTVTQEIIKTNEKSTSLRNEETSNFKKIRDKLAGSEVFAGGRMTKEELKLKVLMETAKELGIDFNKEKLQLNELGKKIIENLDRIKMNNPELYDRLINSLNKELGLNLLGLSVVDFALAARDPKSDRANELERRLDEIFDMKNLKNSTLLDELQKHMGELEDKTIASSEADEDKQKQASIVTDSETGTYKPAVFPPSRK